MFRVWIGLLLGLLSSIPGSAAESTRLILYYVPLEPLISSDGRNGPLIEAIEEIGRRAQVRFDPRHLTLPRIARKIDDGARVATFPILEATARKTFKGTVRLSAPMGFRISQVYMRKGDTTPQTISAFEHRVLVTAPNASLPAPLYASKALTTLEARSLKAALNILLRGRADILINDITITDYVIQSTGLTGVGRDAEGLTFVQPAHIAFSSTVPRRLSSRINIAILSMVADGTLKRLLPNNFVEDYMAFQSERLAD